MKNKISEKIIRFSKKKFGNKLKKKLKQGISFKLELSNIVSNGKIAVMLKTSKSAEIVIKIEAAPNWSKPAKINNSWLYRLKTNDNNIKLKIITKTHP